MRKVKVRTGDELEGKMNGKLRKKREMREKQSEGENQRYAR